MNTRIETKIVKAVKSISENYLLRSYVDNSLKIPKVHQGNGEIKLIILGQDPTVKNRRARKNIKTVLNLDKHGRLLNYLTFICLKLGIDLNENVYATNYMKNFFIDPPTQIKDVDIFNEFEPYWLPLLHEEVSQFPNVPIISLGQPLLRVFAIKESSPRVRDYWGYSARWKLGVQEEYQLLKPEGNKLQRLIFPFPHQPSVNKQFYCERLVSYIDFMSQRLDGK